MRYHVLACDYDGTLAHDGIVDDATINALRLVRESGRRLLLVTGRELDELQSAFPHLELFDRVVAENGALLFDPSTKNERLLGDPPPPTLVEKLKQAGVMPISVGRVIVATWEPHETTVLAAIRDLGLEYQVIFNKGAVMVLPPGITKATGFAAALRELSLSPHNTVAVGDAENDHHLIRLAEFGVAVANAVPSLKQQADWVTPRDHGAGVVDLIEKLLENDLTELTSKRKSQAISLGRVNDEDRSIPPYGINLLLTGGSGGGKSTLATAFVEQVQERRYQYCVVDPEGDYSSLDCVSFGRSDQSPDIEQVVKLLRDPNENCVVNLLGVTLEDRPGFFARLLTALLDLRAQTGRPHWIVVDEAHHMLPATQQISDTLLAPGLSGVVWITVYPDHVAPQVFKSVEVVVVVGEDPAETFRKVCKMLDRAAPRVPNDALPPGEAYVWRWRTEKTPERISTLEPRTERRRHRRKYVRGELAPDLSFYFRGPEEKLNLRAQNLALFMQSAEGVDDATWLYHLHRGDYSRWFRNVIKDESLADATHEIERQKEISVRESRAQLRRQIEQRYGGLA